MGESRCSRPQNGVDDFSSESRFPKYSCDRVESGRGVFWSLNGFGHLAIMDIWQDCERSTLYSTPRGHFFALMSGRGQLSGPSG